MERVPADRSGLLGLVALLDQLADAPLMAADLCAGHEFLAPVARVQACSTPSRVRRPSPPSSAVDCCARSPVAQCPPKAPATLTLGEALTDVVRRFSAESAVAAIEDLSGPLFNSAPEARHDESAAKSAAPARSACTRRRNCPRCTACRRHDSSERPIVESSRVMWCRTSRRVLLRRESGVCPPDRVVGERDARSVASRRMRRMDRRGEVAAADEPFVVCSIGRAPVRRSAEASLGKMPTRSERRPISRLARCSGFVDLSLDQYAVGNGRTSASLLRRRRAVRRPWARSAPGGR